jgi:hypothetical protein
MPRSATTLFGLALVACSIGFNIWRYPIVWQMAGPMAPAAATSAIQPIKSPLAKPEPAMPPPTLPTGSEPKSVRGAAVDVTPTGAERGLSAPTGVTSEKFSPLPQAPPLQWGGVSRQRGSIESHTSLERPLVPVPRMAAVAKPIGMAEPAGAVRRLPPVDPNVPPMAGPGLSGGAIPVYPSTGIE